MHEMETIKARYIPAMNPPMVLDYLTEIGRSWKGKGVTVELGAWLGATAAALLTGLKEAEYDRPFYCFDRWKANDSEQEKAKKQGVKVRVGQDLLPLFLENVAPIYSNIKAYQGEIHSTIHKYKGGPIEICMFDAPKRNPIFRECVQILSPYWIPGVTILVLLDYYFYEQRKKDAKKFMAPVHFIEQHKDKFIKLIDWPGETSCAVFKYKKKL